MNGSAGNLQQIAKLLIRGFTKIPLIGGKKPGAKLTIPHSWSWKMLEQLVDKMNNIAFWQIPFLLANSYPRYDLC